MPTYEYQCGSCGHQFEEFQKINDAPVKTCPKCHDDTVARLISATSFQLKGTGWYATDFRDKGKPKAENAAKESNETQSESQKKDKPQEKVASTDSSKTTKDSTD